MASHLHLALLWLLVYLFSSDGKEQELLSQMPRWASKPLGENIMMWCFQNNTDHSWMYWYQQKAAGQPLELIGILIRGSPKPTFEDTFKDKGFAIQSHQEKHCSLQISKLKAENVAMYFCASYAGSTTGEMHFGTGTKLTVLEKGQKTSPPEVTIFAPSAQEVKDKQKATIVCLATDFFPDHVNLTWFMNGEARTEGVKTDTPELDKTKKKYSLVSRLRITKKEWQDSNNEFKCRIAFYDENGESHYEDEISGIECGGSAEAKETYLRRANVGKLVYILLIFKSFLYGAFVMGLKLQKKVVP